MADGKRRYKSDRKDYKVSVKLSEKDMDILKSPRTTKKKANSLFLNFHVDITIPAAI